jgi:hypothetical protein
MALVINDRVKETTTTTGTGAISLGGAVTGFETFAAGIGNSNTVYYCIAHQTAAEFEVGLGTLDGDSSDLTRTTVISSSNSDSAVDFSAGTKDVFCTIPASKLIFEDANNDATIGRNLTVTGDLTITGDDITMNTNTSGAALIGDGTNFNPVTISGDISIAANGTAAIGSGVIVNADINSSAAIAMSKTAFTAGTGVSLSTNTLSVDASQTGITSVTNTSLVIGRDADNDIDFATDNTILFRADGADQIKLVNGALAPVTDNDIDLGTSSLEFKDAFFDGTVTADAFAGPLTGNVTGNVSGTAATVTGAAQSNITSLGTLTTLTVDNIIVNGTTIGHTDDTDLITLADGIATVAGEISVTTLDIGGTNVTSTAAELNILDGVTSTATELNIMDGDTSASSTTLVDADRVVTNDAGTMKQVALSDVKTYLTSAGFSTEDPTALAIALG